MNKLILITFGIAMTVVLALGATAILPTNQQIKNQDQQLPEIKKDQPVPNAPKLKPVSQLGFESVNSAQSRIKQFTIRQPPSSALPRGFSLRGAMGGDLGSATYKGVTLRMEDAILLYYDKNISPNMTISDFFNAGGIELQYIYGPGENSTAPFEGELAINKEQGRAVYMWGYPALITPGFISVYNFQEHLSYIILYSPQAHQEQEMLGIMESLIKG